MSLTTATLNSLAGSVLGRTAYTSPATLYAALFVGASDGITGGTEASTGNYNRVAVTNNTTNFSAPSGGVVSLQVPIVFPTSSAAWGSINCVRLMDASSGGNVVGGAILSPTVTVDAAGITTTIGTLTLTLSNVS